MRRQQKKNVKKAIGEAYAAPEPKKKEAFLRSVNFPRTTRLDFLIAQIGYIRKRVWVLSFAAALPVLLILPLRIDIEWLYLLGVLMAFLPFVALMGISEIARSISCNMAELESSCKYSFQAVVIARLAILGAANAAMLGIIILALGAGGSIGTAFFGLYLLAPFLLVCVLSLFALNRLRTREHIYVCGGIACFVSVMSALLSGRFSFIYTEEYTGFWLAAVAALIIWMAAEVARLIRKMEDNQWNWSQAV